MFKFNMGSKKNLENKIAEIKKWTTTDIPALINHPDCDAKMYFQKGRLVLNLMLIEALIGAEIKKDEGKKAKGDYVIKFNRHLPTASELGEIVDIVDTFVTEVETPFLDRIAPMQSGDDMGIPQKSNIRLEKLNKKSMYDLIFNGGNDAMTNRMINTVDCVQLAGIGEQLRKKTIRNRVLIVGGVALVITGAGMVGYNMYKKKHEGNNENSGDVNDGPMVDIGGDDMPDVNIGDDSTGDAPVVTIE
ncbi:MAG: hypothetical protein NC548_37060 [Lachnospiraceae bacterium]|nr:hypothetical protein [Lachnospiraceae bacterium]